MAINKLTVNGVEIPSVKSVTYKETVNSGVDLRPGCVASAYIEAEVYGTQADAVAPGAEVSYYLVDADSNETLIGVFAAEPSIKTKTSYKFVAYDNAQKLNTDFSAWLRDHQADFPVTRAALVAAACTIAGVTNATPNWTGSEQTVDAFYADVTCRDILSYAAELSGYFVKCHADGSLYFEWYTATPNTRIYPSSGVDGSETRYAYKQDGMNYANYTVPAIDGVAVHPSGEDDVAYIYPASPAGSNLLHIRNNLLLTGATAAVYNAAAQRIYTQMTAVGAYVPATASMFANECPYESGETVLVTDIQGVSFKTIVMSKTVTASGVVLESTGNETQDAGAENSRKAIAQLASDIVQIDKLKVGYAEIAQAVIDVLIANDITAQNLTIVDENGNVLATYSADGITLGQTGETHAEIDFNSFELLDKSGNVYLYAGAINGNDGLAVIDESSWPPISSGGYYEFYTKFPITSVVSVFFNGTEVQSSDYVVTSNAVKIPTTNSYGIGFGSTLNIIYKTTTIVYRFDFGRRNLSGYIGAFSVIVGDNQVASAPYSVAIGGNGNTADGENAVVVGGNGNSIKAINAASIGGETNKVCHSNSVISGGASNKIGTNENLVLGEENAIVGGNGGAITDLNSRCVILGGKSNSVNLYGSDNAVVIGGIGGKANSQSQVVLGEYNTASSPPINGTYRDAKLEIVGNGTADNARSNARTLDWNGNEWLAGQINADTGNFRNGATSSGNIDITGGYVLRRLPAVPSAGTGYWLARITESNGTTGRGGVQFYRSSTNGDGIRMSIGKTINGSAISNILALFVDDNGNRVVAVSEQAPWQKGLGMVYQAGDSITFTATGTNGYTIWAGNIRSGNFNVTIPLDKPVAAGVTADVTGQIILVHQSGVIVVNLDTDVTKTVIISPSGITLHAVFNTTPSGITANRPCTFQSYGTTITFS